MILAADGTIEDDIEFFAATIESKAKLAYDDVSDWLENNGSWQPEARLSRSKLTAAGVCLRRSEWRKTHALVFKDRPDYRLCWAKKAKCWISSPNRVASPTALSKSR
jgi:exoribonuclease-2